MTVDDTLILSRIYAPGLRPSNIETDIGFDESGCYLRFRHVPSGTPYKFYSEAEVVAFATGMIVGIQVVNTQLRTAA